MDRKLKKVLSLMLAVVMCLMFLPCQQVEAATTPAPRLNKKAATIYAGYSVNLTLRNVKKLKQIQWFTSDRSVAVVSPKGVVTGLKAGKAYITAVYKEKSYVAAITVKAGKLNKSTLTLYTGSKYQLSWKGTTAKIKWKSSSSKIAKVGSKGVVYAQKPGTATITATLKGKKFRCVVTVIQPLKDRDFDYMYANQYGYKNYIDMVLAKGSHWFRAFNEIETEYAKENRGVCVGDSFEDVIRAYGEEQVVKVTSQDAFKDKFRGPSYPLNAVRYTYKERGVEYYKKFYFDRYQKVVLIIWYNGQSWKE